VIFLFVVIAVISLMYGYIGWRMIVPAALGQPLSPILWGILIVSVFLPFIPMLLRMKGLSGIWVEVIAWIAYLSFGFFTLLFAFLVMKDVILLAADGLHKIIGFAGNTVYAGQSSAEAVDPERRRVLVNMLNIGVLGVTGAVTGYGLFGALRKPDIVRVTVPIKNLPEEFEGFTIAQISDVHISQTIKRPFVETIVGMVNDLNPDLIALTGDLVDGSVAQLRGDAAPLANLKAPHSSFFITGNHDYYSGVEDWIKETTRLGFDVLLNEHRLIERGEAQIVLAGVTDYSAGTHYGEKHRSDPHKAIAGAPPNLAKILLAHQPSSIVEAAKAGFDYVLSGHTHGGQYFPYHFLVALFQPYVSGFHAHDTTHIYVSRGTGYWGPQLRIGARSEITLHTLTAAKI